MLSSELDVSCVLPAVFAMMSRSCSLKRLLMSMHVISLRCEESLDVAVGVACVSHTFARCCARVAPALQWMIPMCCLSNPERGAKSGAKWGSGAAELLFKIA